MHGFQMQTFLSQQNVMVGYMICKNQSTEPFALNEVINNNDLVLSHGALLSKNISQVNHNTSCMFKVSLEF